jgi:LysR family transcriptional regulator, transcription activator of glutamate synthase operon
MPVRLARTAWPGARSPPSVDWRYSRLHVAQPAVSAQIRQLERELGVQLLARTTRRVSLTAAGTTLLAYADRVLAELDHARAELDTLSTVLRGTATLGATLVLSGLDLPAALARFHTRFPVVKLALRTGLVAQLLEALDAAGLDLVVGPVHPGLPRRYVARPLARERLVVISPPAYRLARVDRIRLADLRDEAFVCLPADSGLRALLDAAAHRAGFRPDVRFETHSPGSIRELVNAGLGVALVAQSVADAPGPPVGVHQPQPAEAHPPIALIRRRDRPLSPAARQLSDELIRAGGRRHLGPTVAPGR